MKKYSFLFFSALMAFSCTNEIELVQVQNYGPTQGTSYQVSYLVPSGTTFQNKIDSILYAVDLNLSVWVETSGISKLNTGDTLRKRDYPLLVNVIDSSRKYFDQTDAFFDITIEPLIQLWGFYSKGGGIPDSARIDSVLKLVGWKHYHDNGKLIWLDEGSGLDVNGIAQGYSVDLIAEFLSQKGIQHFMVEVGGEVRAKGKNVDERIWRIGIDKPVEAIEYDRLQEIISLSNSSLATSGNYRKYKTDPITGKKYGHSVNSRSGYPEESDLLSATVLSHSATRSDAWGTAMMVAGLERTKEIMQSNKGLQAYWILTDRKGQWMVKTTEGFQFLLD